MNIDGEHQISATRERVWEALNDAEVLRRALPGCEHLERVADDRLNARIVVRIGPVKATFDAEIVLSDLDPPAGYTLSGEGKGGVAGFAVGEARVRLREEGGGTVLAYAAEVRVGGKIAQVGSRLFKGAANKVIAGFFEKFVEILADGS